MKKNYLNQKGTSKTLLCFMQPTKDATVVFGKVTKIRCSCSYACHTADLGHELWAEI